MFRPDFPKVRVWGFGLRGFGENGLREIPLNLEHPPLYAHVSGYLEIPTFTKPSDGFTSKIHDALAPPGPVAVERVLGAV